MSVPTNFVLHCSWCVSSDLFNQIMQDSQALSMLRPKSSTLCQKAAQASLNIKL